jgi:hypothetical protein
MGCPKVTDQLAQKHQIVGMFKQRSPVSQKICMARPAEALFAVAFR